MPFVTGCVLVLDAIILCCSFQVLNALREVISCEALDVFL